LLLYNSVLGAFLIPYFILYFLIGAPIYYLELALGQFSSRGPATAFILAKGWQGNYKIKESIL
jgi:solute carrier family 6 amino acid transporter-like protein 5/7/9/14